MPGTGRWDLSDGPDPRVERVDRRAILAGRRHRLVFGDPCPVSPGETLRLHPEVAIRITQRRRKGEAWLVAFVLLDHRSRLLHRDSSHGYTSIPALALVEEPEAPPSDYVERDRVSRGVEQQDALLRARRRADEAHRFRARRIASAAPRARRAIVRQLRAAEVAA